LLISESNRTSYIIIDKDRCKACHICISVCPRQIIHISDNINQFGYNYADVIVAKAHECTGCKSCAIMCPDIAISVYSCRILESDAIS
jgi:2-oxoglutarate ferredoxin oxidoreductase subunit delta